MPGVEPGSKVFMKCLYCCGHSGSPISLRMGKKRKRRIGAFYGGFSAPVEAQSR